MLNYSVFCGTVFIHTDPHLTFSGIGSDTNHIFPINHLSGNALNAYISAHGGGRPLCLSG